MGLSQSSQEISPISVIQRDLSSLNGLNNDIVKHLGASSLGLLGMQRELSATGGVFENIKVVYLRPPIRHPEALRRTNSPLTAFPTSDYGHNSGSDASNSWILERIQWIPSCLRT